MTGQLELPPGVKKQLEARVILTGWPPPFDFSPPKEPPDQIAAHDLPVSPDPLREPRAYANWLAALSGDFNYVPADIDHLDDIFAIRVTPLVTRPPAIRTGAMASPRFSESSRNWSGALIRPSIRGRFTRIQGAWTVPEPCPGAERPDRAPLPDGEYAISTWIGLDGYDAGTLSLPQCGTGQFVRIENGRVAERIYRAFWEWWARDFHEQSWAVTIKPDKLPCAPGHRFFCEIDVLAPDRVLFFFKNETTGDVLSFAVKPPHEPAVETIIQNVRPDLTGHVPVQVLGGTAEWILESPSDWITNRQFTLADFHPIEFRRCVAEQTSEADATAKSERSLLGARLIRLADWFDRQRPGLVVSEPALGGWHRMIVRYSA